MSMKCLRCQNRGAVIATKPNPSLAWGEVQDLADDNSLVFSCVPCLTSSELCDALLPAALFVVSNLPHSNNRLDYAITTLTYKSGIAPEQSESAARSRLSVLTGE